MRASCINFFLILPRIEAFAFLKQSFVTMPIILLCSFSRINSFPVLIKSSSSIISLSESIMLIFFIKFKSLIFYLALRNPFKISSCFKIPMKFPLSITRQALFLASLVVQAAKLWFISTIGNSFFITSLTFIPTFIFHFKSI